MIAMAMTNKKIYDYYIYERNDGFGKEAIEVLAKINKTTEDGIKAILREQGVIFKEDEKMMTAELKAQIIKDYNEGMTIKDIAERYQLNAHTLSNNMKNWQGKGLVTLRLPEKPVHKPKTKTDESVAESTQAEKPATEDGEHIEFKDAIERLNVLKSMLEVLLHDSGDEYKITGLAACNVSDYCEIDITINGVDYILKMKQPD